MEGLLNARKYLLLGLVATYLIGCNGGQFLSCNGQLEEVKIPMTKGKIFTEKKSRVDNPSVPRYFQALKFVEKLCAKKMS